MNLSMEDSDSDLNNSRKYNFNSDFQEFIPSQDSFNDLYVNNVANNSNNNNVYGNFQQKSKYAVQQEKNNQFQNDSFE